MGILIYDESGLVVGSTGELREETEEQDMFWCDCCDEFHAVGEDCPPPKHDAMRYVVEEHSDSISRNHFVMQYLLARENSAIPLRQCW